MFKFKKNSPTKIGYELDRIQKQNKKIKKNINQLDRFTVGLLNYNDAMIRSYVK